MVLMLRLSGGQVESLWDEVLPGEVKELPEDLAALNVLLSDRRLLEPIAADWRREAVCHGRPSIPMDVYVRLMIVEARTGWGYETLVREVSDSLHLRRFCLIALGERVPHESTVRKLTRRLGGGVVEDLTRYVIAKAQHETRFHRVIACDYSANRSVRLQHRFGLAESLRLAPVRRLCRHHRQRGVFPQYRVETSRSNLRVGITLAA